LISESAWNSLLARLKACENNEQRLSILDKEKAPFLFTSVQLMVMIDITLSVKTRLAFIEKLGPRLTDPKSKASQFVALFRFSEEKERVEGILKSRTQVVMSNTSLYRPQGLSSSLGGADHHHSSHSASQGLAVKGLAGVRQKSTSAPAAPALTPAAASSPARGGASPPVVSLPRESASPLDDAMASMSIWRDVTSPVRVKHPEQVQQLPQLQQVQQLQEGWCAMKDPSTAQTYYYNELTGESQWDPPLAAESPSSRAKRQLLPDGWTIMTDSTTASTYYYNRNTGESRWTLDDEEEVAEATAQRSPSPSPSALATTSTTSAATVVHRIEEAPLAAGWVALTDGASGRSYYFNSSSGASQWERPLGDPAGAGVGMTATVVPQSAAVAAPVQLEALQRLPAGWEEMKDPASGRAYYHNRASGRTQWDMPR
jgi:hypothetical protein